MAKRAVCVGINNYPGTSNDLNGCVNDANEWTDLLKTDFQFGADVQTIIDSDATKGNILQALGDLVTDAGSGDVVVFTYSGHGTWYPDQGEDDEPDNRDEAICACDADILDDEIRGVIRRLDPAARLTVISDSCHSGTVTRARLERTLNAGPAPPEHAPRPRYMPPVKDVHAFRSELIPIRRRFLYPESDMQEVLLTGCNATESSWDAYIDGQWNGAMSANAIRLIKSDLSQTYRQLHQKLHPILVSRTNPQHPQLEGSDANKDRPLFT